MKSEGKLPMAIAHLSLLLVAGWSAACIASAEPRAAGESPYRLALESGAFRLAVPEVASSSAKAPAIPVDLQSKPYAALIHGAAVRATLEPELVHAIIAVESGYRPEARSHKGAIGLMQVMPATALRYGIKDPGRSLNDNLRAGTLYLKDLMRQFNDRLDLVLAAYNAGENAVLRHGGRIPPYEETRRYVPAVLEKYRELRQPPAASKPVKPRIEYISGTRLDQQRIEFSAEQQVRAEN